MISEVHHRPRNAAARRERPLPVLLARDASCREESTLLHGTEIDEINPANVAQRIVSPNVNTAAMLSSWMTSTRAISRRALTTMVNSAMMRCSRNQTAQAGSPLFSVVAAREKVFRPSLERPWGRHREVESIG